MQTSSGHVSRVNELKASQQTQQKEAEVTVMELKHRLTPYLLHQYHISLHQYHILLHWHPISLAWWNAVK